MSKKTNPLPGRSAPLNSGAYNWAKSWAHGGSQMIGDANLPSGRKRRRASRPHGPVIFALTLMGVVFLAALVMHFAALF